MTATSAPTFASTVRSYVEMTKPRIIELLLVTTIPAMAVAADGWPGLGVVLVALVGGALSAGGANVINQVYDDDIDRIMRRTVGRPLPTERVTKTAATVFGLALGFAGFIVLWIGTTLLAGILSVVAYAFYVLVYTMVLKRSSTQNIVIGGAAGAVPALIGWAAVTGSLATAAWVMFAIVFFWTPPHFWALAIKYQDDYRAAHIPMLPVVAGERTTFDHIVSYSIVTVGVSALLVPTAGMGWIYASVSTVSGVVLVAYAWRVRSGLAGPMAYFGYTNVYLATVFLAMLVDRVVLTNAVGFGGAWVVAGAAFVVFGLTSVAVVERRPGITAPGVSPVRHFAEVAVTIAFGLGVVAAVGSMWLQRAV